MQELHIQYTEHAENRLLKRGIQRQWVEEALTYPDKTHSAPAGRTQAIKNIGEEKISVIYVKEHGIYTIITVHWGE